MKTDRRNVGMKFLSIAVALFLMSAFGALCGPVDAQTWGRLYHGPWTEWWTGTTFYGTLPTSDGGYLLMGTSNNRGVILKVLSDGTLHWSKLIKGNGYQKDTSMVGAVEALNGDFIVSGQVFVDQTINPGAGAGGSWDIYVMRLDAEGNVLWEKVYGRKYVGLDSSTYDAHDMPQFVYKDCTQAGGACSYIVTGSVIYSGVPACPYSGYRASQTLAIDDQGTVKNDFLMAGPSATGDGAVETIYTSDGSYLVLNELSYANSGLYTTGVQKYGPTGSLLWTKSYYEAYHQPDGDHILKISAGRIAEAADGYVVAGSTYYNVSGEPALGAYYNFKVDKATGSTVSWNKKFRAWAGWDSLWVLNFATTPDGGLVASIGDGTTTANDRLFKTSQSNGDLFWVNEYGANLGTVMPGGSELVLTTSAFDALLAKLSAEGHMDDSCRALPISDKTSEATPSAILRTEVRDGYVQSECNSAIGRVAAYSVGLVEAGEYHEANRCAPYPELSVSRNGDFGTVNVGSSGGDIEIDLSNYNGLSNLDVASILLSDTADFSLASDSCSGKTLYPVNIGTPTSCAALVRFTPVSNGAKECTVTFSSNYDEKITATLKGKGAGGASISGTVLTSTGPLSGVSLALSGAASKTTTTGSDGTYEFSGLSNGAYTITPSKNQYTFDPASRNITVNDTDWTGQNFTGSALVGSLTVALSPKGAVDAGAMWNVDGGNWMNSGAIVSGLAVGSHTVGFKGSIPGWTAPSGQTVKILSGKTSSASGTYVALSAADFSASPTSGKAPLLVRFTDKTTGSVKSRLWEFGDKKTSTKQNPSNTYTKTGTYTVKLTVTRSTGAKETKTQPNYITVYAPPKAVFSATPTTGKAPLTVKFTDKSTGSVSSWLWKFGDGGTSTEKNPVYTYKKAGTYTVSLTAAGAGGTNTATKSRFIKVNK